MLSLVIFYILKMKRFHSMHLVFQNLFSFRPCFVIPGLGESPRLPGVTRCPRTGSEEQVQLGTGFSGCLVNATNRIGHGLYLDRWPQDRAEPACRWHCWACTHRTAHWHQQEGWGAFHVWLDMMLQQLVWGVGPWCSSHSGNRLRARLRGMGCHSLHWADAPSGRQARPVFPGSSVWLCAWNCQGILEAKPLFPSVSPPPPPYHNA